jgi:CspA family cold shock protein
MPVGTVKYVESNGRWGFISRDDKEPKVFLHISAVAATGHETIEKGQRWSFDLIRGNDGRWTATNLQPV